MNSRKIFFRADAGPDIGMGHFTRTLALAKMLHKEFHCIYAIRKPSEYQKAEIDKVCEGRVELPDDDTHFNEFLKLLRGDEIVVLDNYFFTTAYQQKIKSLGCKLVCVDDVHDRHYVADLVINHAEGIDSSAISAEPYTHFALGFRYALLRGEFLSDYSDEPKQYSFLVMMGGADPYNITYRISEIINSLNMNIPAAVVIGEGNFDPRLENFENITLFKNLNAATVRKMMYRSRAGIFPASTVSIEACATRLPFLCGYFIDNQMKIYSGLQKKSLALCIGDFCKVDKQKLMAAVEKMRDPLILKRLKQNQKRVLDKKSKERFLELFHEL